MKIRMAVFFVYILFVSVTFAQSQHPQSRVITDTIFSKILNAERPFNVYLPPSFDQGANKKYPVLYLLHGLWGNNHDWTSRGHLQEVTDRLIGSGETREMVIVTPYAGGNPHIEQNGYFDMPGWKYEEFFFTEFLPYIENTYRVIGDKDHRAIAGLSMGGGGATSYAQRHSEMFCAVYAMSALMSIPEGDLKSEYLQNDKFSLLQRTVVEKSCVKYVLEADSALKEQLCRVQWFVDCGDDDFLLDRNIEFYQAMRNSGIPCQFRVRDGAHDFEYWHSALYTCLPFVTRAFFKE